MQSLINKPGGQITKSLQGMALCHSDVLRIHFDPDYVERTKAAEDKVAVVSGSGSGHEPLPVGYVGEGMLDAACPGPIFTSPSPMQMMAAVRAVDRARGVLLIAKNYTGGVLNSELTREIATQEGIITRTVIVNDDVSIPNRQNRRGLGASVTAFKIAGAAAEAGYDLDYVADITQRSVDNARSMGFATNSNTLHRSTRASALADDMVELGVGIHGEPGTEIRVKDGSQEIVRRIVEPIVEDLPFRDGDSVLLLVSGLGGTPPLELYLFYLEIFEFLKTYNLNIERQLVGNYLTSLGRGGCIVTLVRLDRELLDLWDAPVHTPVLHW